MGLRLHIVMRRPLFLISQSKSQIYLARAKWKEKVFLVEHGQLILLRLFLLQIFIISIFFQAGRKYIVGQI
jgi:hypothetical protein